MRNFSFTQEERNNTRDIESILRQRKRKIARQQMVYIIILLAIIMIILLWLYNKTVYAEFDGYVTADVNYIRPEEDVYFLESDFLVGDLVLPGDTMFSYVIASNFYGHERLDYEPDVIARNRDLKIQYGLVRQDLEVLRVRISELQRRLDTEDHNIRFGLSNNHNKLRTEQELAEAKEQYKAQRRKLGVLWNGLDQTERSVKRLNNDGHGYLYASDMRDIKLMERLGLVRYTIAVDSVIMTKKYVSSYTLVLRGEPVMSTQSLDLRSNNLAVAAYVMPDYMKYVNYHTQADIIVNEEIHYNASVLMLGSRTEEIPGELRNTLSRDHTASIVMFDINPGQDIPYWSLTNGVPVKVRINKLNAGRPRPDDYIIYNTTDGVQVNSLKAKFVEESNRRRRRRRRSEPSVIQNDTAVAVTAEAKKEKIVANPDRTAGGADTMITGDANGHYHIIVASGDNNDGAKRRVAQLKEQGYKGARVITSGDKNRVSIASFATLEKANTALGELKKDPLYANAWVVYSK